MRPANTNIASYPTKEEARASFFKKWTPTVETEEVSAAQCLNRVAAEDIYSVNTIPAVRISAMDGYAVKSENFAAGIPDVSKWIPEVDFVSADTGDDFPDEFDTVIPVEKLQFNEEGILVLDPEFTFRAGECIRPRGCMMQEGDLLVSKNTRITPELHANLLIGGIQVLKVIRKPRVTFIPTGSELVAPGTTPTRGTNIDSNSTMIADLLLGWQADVKCCPIIKDDRELLEKTLDEAVAASDIILINGGSSKGTEDFNTILVEEKASYFQHSTRTVPGMPVGISVINGKAVINVPGPVLAAWAVCDWLIYPMICRWYQIPERKRRTVTAFLDVDFKKGPPVEVYSFASLEKRGEFYYATPLGRGNRSSELLHDGLGLIIAPVGEMGWIKGEAVSVELLRSEEEIPVSEKPADIEIPKFCSECDNHCSTSHLLCGRGKAKLERIRSGKDFNSGDETADALVSCAQQAMHMYRMKTIHEDQTGKILSGLNDEEQAQLLHLLKKQQAAWNKEQQMRLKNRGGNS